MTDKKSIIIGILIIIVIILGVSIFGKQVANAPAEKEMATTTEDTKVTTEIAPSVTTKTSPTSSKLPLKAPDGSYYVYYTSSGFSPNVVTIKQGQTITFINKTTTSLRLMSNDHPTHQKYSEFNMSKTVGVGGKFSFTFLRAGVWGYHNETALYHAGTVIVNP